MQQTAHAGAGQELTLQESVSLLRGDTTWSVAGVERLGLAPLVMSDGPNGARGTSMTSGTSACFPCASALAASWDPELVGRVGAALGVEARRVGADVLLAPTINLHRSPLAGRSFECFSEDPLLTGRLAVAYVRGVQAQGVAACAKHLVCNDSEHERMTISSEVADAPLHELYLEPFRHALVEGGAWAVMAAYNRLGGTYCSEHPWLLTELLREQWGWDGVVVSDWFGTHSAVDSLQAGLDVEMPGPALHRGSGLLPAVEAGDVPPEVLDRSVERVLRLRERTALPPEVPAPDVAAVALEAAVRGAVLLRNEQALLPLDLPRVSRLALVGPDAATGQVQGGGSAQVRPSRVVAPVAGLRAVLGEDVELLVERGCTITDTAPALDAASLRTPEGEPGARLELIEGSDPAGPVVAAEVVPRLHALWLGSPGHGLTPGGFSVRLTAVLRPNETGPHVLSLAAAGTARIRLDGEEVVGIDTPEIGGAFFGLGSPEHRAQVQLTAGAAYLLEAEFVAAAGIPLAGVTVGMLLPTPPDLLERAVAAAASADVAVVLVGLNADWGDRGARPGRDGTAGRSGRAGAPRRPG